MGAGFSKALNPAYPTLQELTNGVKQSFIQRYKNGALREHYNQLPELLKTNIELLLNYLFTNWPWKTTLDKDLDSALYKALMYEIYEQISSIVTNTVSDEYIRLVRYIATSNHSVLTLNYDTLLEDVLAKFSNFKTGEYCQVELYIEDDFDDVPHITSSERPYIVTKQPEAQYKTKLTMNREFVERLTADEFTKIFSETGHTFWTHTSPKDILPRLQRKSGSNAKFENLIKLHGSLDWVDEQSETIGLFQPETTKKAKIPLIVPPVLDKSKYYFPEKIRDLWFSAHDHLRKATEIIIIGFSFPPTDISVRLLFQSALKTTTPVRIVVVNRDSAQNIRPRYEEVFGELGDNVERDYLYCGNEYALTVYVQNEIKK